MLRNYILFIVLSAIILAGWYAFISSRDSQKKKPSDEKKIAKVEPPKDNENKKKDTIEPKKDEKPKPIVPEKEEPLKEESLGGEGYHLTVDTISRGAGVWRLVLNRFNAADWRGRPTDPVKPLELIQADKFTPSYRMYHYVNASDQNPVLGLGEKIWKLEGRDETPDKVQEVRYSTTVPGLEHIKIVKTYRLAPTDYHVTLLLEFHDLRKQGDQKSGEIPFRYQLVGATGLPIEGEWYASTFRNALIGMTDKSKNLWRQLEDSLRISHRKGGDRFPEAKGSDFSMQYAGVANQYFAAVILPDNNQPSKDDGGGDPTKILAWARPTLETIERSGQIIGMNLNKQETWFQEPRLTYKLTEKAQKQVEAINLVAGRDMVLSYRFVKGVRTATWVRAKDDPRPAFDEKEESTDIHGLVTKISAKEIVFLEDKQHYDLLPRTEQHFKDLDLHDGMAVALSFYTKPDGKRVATWVRLGETARPQFDDITVRVISEPIPLGPNDKVRQQFMLYHGPIKAALLAQQSGDNEVPAELVDRYTDTLHLNTLTDYRSDNFFGKISSFFGLTRLIILVTRFMHWLFYFLHVHAYLPYGLCIMVLTVIVRGCMFPISRRQALFSIKMQQLAPEMKKIAEKYKDDLQARSQATSELQKKHGVHPLSSCWPVFLQMPIFLGLYFAMQESIHFRLADFLWIKNLAAPDMLVWWSENIWWISAPDNLGSMLYLGPYFNILPMVAVGLMMVQQLQTMPPPTDEQQAMQQKMMKYMTIVFGIMFYKVAAGLCIYFIASSLWGCAERMLLPKKKPAPTGGAGGTDGIAGKPEAPAVPPPNNKWKNKNAKPVKKEESGLRGKVMAWWQEVLKQAEKK